MKREVAPIAVQKLKERTKHAHILKLNYSLNTSTRADHADDVIINGTYQLHCKWFGANWAADNDVGGK